MNGTDSASVGGNLPERTRRPIASHFTNLPGTPMGWIAVGVTAAYVALVTVMAQVPLGLPTWLDFTLALAPGVAAIVLVGIALIRDRERSWLLWLAVLGIVYAFGGWLIFAAMVLGA